MFQAVLPLEPLARPRQRHRIVFPKDGRPPYVQSYTPSDSDYEAWCENARLVFQSVRRGAPGLSGPLGLKAVLLFPMPLGEHRKTPRGRRWHTAKPDIDNVLKAVLDTMVAAGWMADDARLSQVEAQKIVAAQGCEPALHLTLFALPPIQAPAPLLETLP